MAPTVEAKSLSEVLALAENPPMSLEIDTTQVFQEQLVLYIARVPGSRDVFLTPIKPREKVVTASDVQSCLYYVHVDSAEDDKLREALLSENYRLNGHRTIETDCSPPGANAVHRKPLRQESESPFDEPPGLTPRVSSRPRSQTRASIGSLQVERKPVGQNVRPTATRVTDSSQKLSTPRLHGARPMHQHLRSADSSVLQPSPERTNVDTKRSEYRIENSPQLPPRLRQGRDQITPNLPPWPTTHTSERSESRVYGPPYENGDGPQGTGKLQEIAKTDCPDYKQDTSLTLIRRYADMQWNVGKISRPSGGCRSDTSINIDYGLPLVDMQDGASIEISTPGYAKFTSRGTPRNGKENFSPTQVPHDYDGEQAYFQRQLQAASFKKPRDQKRTPEFSSDSTPSSHGFNSKFKLHRRSQISESDDRVDFPRQASPTQSTIDSKGYVLQSPWDGVCEFYTGVAGRSLKCTHTVLPLRNISKAQPRSAPVSELRFNLPSSKSLAASPVSKPRVAERLLGRSSSSSQQQAYDDGDGDSSSADSDRLDLSLGQELAGGGFGGKQAKLGKLIIEIEGLKMLDLLVAANIGIWWRVYEKTSM